MVFTRQRDGGLLVRLEPDGRDLLRSLPKQLEALLAEAPDDPSLYRLAPPAYQDDAEQEAEYRRYMGDDLRERRRAALALLAGTADAERLDEEEAQAWLAALNSLRLVIGTRLGVQEDDDPYDLPEDEEEAGAVVVYHYLSVLLEDLVGALAEGLPEVVDD